MSSGNKGGPDLSFSSSSEIKSFVRGKMGYPGYIAGDSTQNSNNPFYKKTVDSGFYDLTGTELCGSSSYLNIGRIVLFRSVFNPVDYNGSTWLAIKESYKTNELGFFIGCCAFGMLAWSWLTYRR